MKKQEQTNPILHIHCLASQLVEILNTMDGAEILAVIPSSFDMRTGDVTFYKILFRYSHDSNGLEKTQTDN